MNNEQGMMNNEVKKYKAEKLNSGIYFYSIAVDGKIVDTKKMLRIK